VFLAMLPKILSYAKIAFRHLDPEARQEAVQNVVTNSCAAVAALARRGKLDLCYPTILALYGIRRTRDHRVTGGRLNITDVMSRYCQDRKGVVVERLDQFDKDEHTWSEVLVEDRRAGPADIAACRLDFAAWLRLLPRRLRKIATLLATGESSTAAAEKFKVSVGRISQIRKELKRRWEIFQGEIVPESAAAA